MPCACGGGCPRCARAGYASPQPSRGLLLSHPSDASERQARAIAEDVLASPAAPHDRSDPRDTGPRGEPPRAQRLARVEHAGSTLATPPITREHEQEIDALRGGGSPLPTDVREYFEPRLGRPLGHVRLHSDTRAAKLASTLDASAFTIGSDIVFARDRLAPRSEPGRRLLAHELAHVAQNDAATRGQEGVIRRDTPASTVPAPAAAAAPDPATAAKAGQQAATTGKPGCWGLGTAVLQDLRGATLTPAEQREIALTGTEVGSFSIVPTTLLELVTGVTGMHFTDDSLSNLTTFTQTLGVVGALAPGEFSLLDLPSALVGRRLNAYAGGKFLTRLREYWCLPATAFLAAQLGLSLYTHLSAQGEPSPNPGGLVSQEGVGHMALIKFLVNLAEPYVTPPAFFNEMFGGASADPFFSQRARHFGADPPSGAALESMKAPAGLPGEYQHYGLTFNASPIIEPYYISLWFDYERLNPTKEIASYGGVPGSSIRMGIIGGVDTIAIMVDMGGTFSASKGTSSFMTGAASYRPHDSVIEQIALKATMLQVSKDDPYAASDASGRKLDTSATRVLPSVKLKLPITPGVSANLDAMLGVTGGGAAGTYVSDAGARLGLTDIGHGTPSLPAKSLTAGIGGSMLDASDPSSAWQLSGTLKGNVGGAYAGVSVNWLDRPLSVGRAALTLDPATQSAGQLLHPEWSIIGTVGFTGMPSMSALSDVLGIPLR